MSSFFFGNALLFLYFPIQFHCRSVCSGVGCQWACWGDSEHHGRELRVRQNNTQGLGRRAPPGERGSTGSAATAQTKRWVLASACAWHASLLPAHDTRRFCLRMTRVAFACTWHVSLLPAHDTRRFCLRMTRVAFACAWRVSLLPAHDACRFCLRMTRVAFAYTCRFCLCMTRVAFACAWHVSLLPAHDTCRFCLRMTRVAFACAWHVSLLPAHDTCRFCLCMTRVAFACAWHMSLLPAHDTRRFCLRMTCVAFTCAWHVSLLPAHDTCRFCLRMTRVAFACAWLVSPTITCAADISCVNKLFSKSLLVFLQERVALKNSEHKLLKVSYWHRPLIIRVKHIFCPDASIFVDFRWIWYFMHSLYPFLRKKIILKFCNLIFWT